MIEKYQKRFIKIMMLSIFIVLMIIESAVNLINIWSVVSSANGKIDYLVLNGGFFDEKPKNEFGMEPHKSPFDFQYFSVFLNQDDEVTQIITSHFLPVSDNQMLMLTQKAISHQKNGWASGFQYRICEIENGKMILFVSIQSQLNSLKTFFLTSVMIVGLALLFLFVLVTMASKKAISPLAQAMEKQKRFISDASHEIKTPLAIISANNEVLSMEIGDNEWIQSNQKQIHRLNELISKLLILTKMDENINIQPIEINLSECLENTISSFKPLMEHKSISCSKNIKENLILSADAQSIQTLINILLDNAIKYCSKPYQIDIKAYSHAKKCCLEVYNSAQNIDHVSDWFERFYRGDSSHSSHIQGQGIGLSIAKAICEAHHGTISAEKYHDGILFKVELSLIK